MNPLTRRLSLTAHITLSVGWLGALAGFLTLSIAGLASHDAERIRSSYISMELLGRFVIVPLSLAALATGIVQALGTEWGLIRHYWVLAKLVLTILATVALLLHQFTAVSTAATIASTAGPSVHAPIGGLGVQLVVNAGAGVLILIAVTGLSVFKPWGPTPFGRHPALERRDSKAAELPRSLKIVLILVAVLAAVFALIHLAGGGLGHTHHS